MIVILGRIAAQLGTSVLPNPPATPSQLRVCIMHIETSPSNYFQMLIEGTAGESTKIRSELESVRICYSLIFKNNILL